MCDFPALSVDFLELPTNIDLAGKKASIGIPESFVASALTACLDENLGGQVKRSKFQKIDLDFENIDFISGGISIIAQVRGRFRELLYRNPLTNREHFTPWLDVSGQFRGDFNASLVNETLNLNFKGADFKFDGPLREIGDFVVSLFKDDPKIRSLMQNELNNFNGLNIMQLFKKLAPGNIKEQLKLSGLSDDDIRKIFDQVQLDANFTDLELRLMGKW